MKLEEGQDAESDREDDHQLPAEPEYVARRDWW